MKKRFLLSGLGILFAVINAFAGSTLKVGTFNIRFNSPADTGLKDWSLRRPYVVKTIMDYDYDVIGLNECRGVAVLQYMKDSLSDYEFVSYSDLKDVGTSNENFNPILFKKEKFRLLDSGVFFLNLDIMQPGCSWDCSNNIRFTPWVKLEVKTTGEIFFFFETHLDHQGNEARNEQARINMEQIRSISGAYPTIIAGDHNSSKTRIPFYNLTSSFMLDSRLAAKKTEGIAQGDGTMGKHKVEGKDFWDPEYYSSSRIDYVWVRGADVEEYCTIHEAYGRKEAPSDHFAIRSVITLNEYNPIRTYHVVQGEDIQTAINNASMGDTILVEAGLFPISGTGKTATLKVNKALTIIGGYNADFTKVIGRTELSGDKKGDDIYENYAITNTSDNLNHLITVPQGSALELYNFDLHGGNTPTAGTAAQGGAIYCTGNFVTLENCIIHDNVAYSNGAGVYCSGKIRVNNCQFYHNISLYGSGAALYSPSNSAELVWRFSYLNSEFYENKAAMGAAIFNGGFSRMLVSACSFHHNLSTNAGIVYATRTSYNGNICFVNNTFTANNTQATTSASLPSVNKGGSAIYLYLEGSGCSVALVNNTIVGNAANCLCGDSVPADFHGAAIQVNSDATVRLYNNIIAGNETNASTGGDVYLENLIHVDTQHNIYSSLENIHMNVSDNDYLMSSYQSALNSLVSMLDGSIEEGRFVAKLTKDGPTSVIVVKNVNWGVKTINEVPTTHLQESRFWGDVNDDAACTTYLDVDQRGATRNLHNLACRGAYEYGVKTDVKDVDNSGSYLSPLNTKLIYNLAGQRLDSLQRGLNIVNGKKIIL